MEERKYMGMLVQWEGGTIHLAYVLKGWGLRILAGLKRIERRGVLGGSW